MSKEPTTTGASPHVAIIGGGSAAFSATHRALALGARVTLCNQGLPLGGTCPNVGCVPSKTLIRAAEAYHRGAHSGFKGLRLEAELLDFAAVVEQKEELVNGLRSSNYERIVPDLPNFRFIPERARLGHAHRVDTANESIHADIVLLATGTTTYIPDLPGLKQARYLTHESAFQLRKLPCSLLVLGGGYIALECAQMFSRFGAEVTVLQRSSHVLSHQPRYLGDGLTEYLRAEGLQVECGVTILSVERTDGTVKVEATVHGESRTFRAEHVLVATGRTPNTSTMGLVEAGVALTNKGYVDVDAFLQTSATGVYAAGDVIGEPELVYTASYEAELAMDNALRDRRRTRDYSALPWVIFTDPQVAGVGLDEQEARDRGFNVDTATLPARRWPRLKVAMDTRGFLKLIRDRKTDHLLGARILAPEGGDLVTELGLAIRHGVRVGELAESFYPYLTLSEGIQRAAQGFEPVG